MQSVDANDGGHRQIGGDERDEKRSVFRDVDGGVVVDLGLLDDDVLVLVADVRKVSARKVPSLNPVSQQHAGGCAAEKEVLRRKTTTIKTELSQKVNRAII